MNDVSVELARVLLEAIPFWNKCIVAIFVIAGIDSFVYFVKMVHDITRK
jgi:hypothetical protein